MSPREKTGKAARFFRCFNVFHKGNHHLHGHTGLFSGSCRDHVGRGVLLILCIIEDPQHFPLTERFGHFFVAENEAVVLFDRSDVRVTDGTRNASRILIKTFNRVAVEIVRFKLKITGRQRIKHIAAVEKSATCSRRYSCNFSFLHNNSGKISLTNTCLRERGFAANFHGSIGQIVNLDINGLIAFLDLIIQLTNRANKISFCSIFTSFGRISKKGKKETPIIAIECIFCCPFFVKSGETSIQIKSIFNLFIRHISSIHCRRESSTRVP